MRNFGMTQIDQDNNQTSLIQTNKTQLQTTSAAIIAGLAGYAAGHGWLGLGLGDWTTIIGSLIGVGAVIWPVLITRAKSLKDTVGKLPQTTVVTDKASADALPNNPDVIAATPEVVAAIKKAS
jgi:hypothetical protein